MRSKNAVLNFVFVMIYELLLMVLGFVFPRMVVLTYGSEINGLSSTITRLLSLINLIQAGAVGTAIFQMYKPVAEQNSELQSAIIFSSKRYYNRFSIIYLFIASVLAFFCAFYLQSDTLLFWQILFAFIVLSINGAISLKVNTICDIFISSYQKKYYLTISSILSLIVNYGLLSIVLIRKLTFLLIYIAILCGTISGALLNFFFYKRLSKGIITEPKDKSFKIPDRKYLMISCIGNEMVAASPPIIVTTFFGLMYTSVFNVYSMVFSSIRTILNSIQLSVSAIFGNLSNSSSDSRTKEVYDLIELITILFGTLLTGCTSFLLSHFITLYTRDFFDIEYYNYMLILFVVIYLCCFTFKSSFSYVSTVYGLFKKTCYITLIWGGIGVSISAITIWLCGFPFVMVGLILSELGSGFSVLYVIAKNVNWFSGKTIMRRSFFMISICIMGLLLSNSVPISIETWISWFVLGTVVGIIILFFEFCYCILFERSRVIMLITYLKTIIGFRMK